MDREKKRLAQIAWRAANPEKAKAYKKAARLANPEKAKAIRKDAYQRHKDRENEISREYKRKHAGRLAAEATAKRIANPTMNRYYRSLRRAAEKRAMPKWANRFFMKEAFELAVLRERICGGKWHVDHIVPLQSKTVCGLHAHTNFQVIPAVVNRSKLNRHIV